MGSCWHEKYYEQVASKICQDWASIFQIERGGRSWRILEKHKAPWKDISLVEKIEKTGAYKEARTKMVEAIKERDRYLAEMTIMKTDLSELGATKAEIEKEKQLSPEFLTRLTATRKLYFLLNEKEKILEKEVGSATRSRAEVFVKEKVRIAGEEADEEIRSKELKIFSKVIEGAIKNIFNSEEINFQIHRTRFEVSFFKWEEKKGPLEELGERVLVALCREGFLPYNQTRLFDGVELRWREATCEVRRTWEQFPSRLNDALEVSLNFDKIKRNIAFNFDFTLWNLMVSLEKVLTDFLEEGFFEALEFVRKEALPKDDSYVEEPCKMQLQ